MTTTTPPALEPIKRDYPELSVTVIRILERHWGPDRIISSMDLAEQAGLPRTKSGTRKLQKVIKEIVHIDRVPVCSNCSNKSPGYFLPETPEQTYPFEHSLTGRALEDFKHRRDLRTSVKEFFAPGKQRRLL